MATLVKTRTALIRRRQHAFTLIEILIVVIIIGILAAIVVPKMTGAAQDARETTLHDQAQFMRTQVALYKSQHLDIAPGYAAGATTATASDLLNQLTMYTDAAGNTSSTSTGQFVYGPYLPKLPTNPMSNLSTVLIVGTGSSMPAADGTTGWVYKPDTLEFAPNNTGSDAQGNAYSSY